MKGLMYRGPGDIRFEDVPDARLVGPEAAIVQTTLCGICGTDLHPYHVDMGARDYCIGHEAVGIVIEVGSDVRRFHKGDRVLLPASIGCGTCRQCAAGHVILCETYPNMRAYGQGDPTIPGCQAEAVAVAAADNNLFSLPDEMSDALGIMLTDNLATASYCTRRGDVREGDTVAVIGLGAIGLQAILMSRSMGAETVYALDLLEHRRAQAAAFGGVAINPADAIEVITEATSGRGVDVVLDAAGGQATTTLAMALVRRGGRVSQIGVSESPDLSFPIHQALFKNVTFATGVCSVQAEIPLLAEMLRDGRLDAELVEGLVTHKLGLSKGAEAYRLFDERPNGLTKVVLDPSA